MITERYVSSSGAGTYAGSTSAAAPMSLTTAFANAVAGDRINIKADGTYARTTTTDVATNAGTITSPIIFRGYLTTPGDGYLGRTNGGSGPLVTTNMPSITYTTGTFTTSAFFLAQCLNITGSPSVALFVLTGNAVAKSCRSVNSSTNAGAYALNVSANFGLAFDCDLELTGASGGNRAVDVRVNGVIDSCRVKVTSATAYGIICGAVSVVYGNLVIGPGCVNGIVTSGAAANCFIRNNTCVGCAGDGINVSSGTTGLQKIIGNMSTDGGGWGINLVSAANGAFLAYNRTRDNSSGAVNLGTDWASATTFAHVTTDTGGAATDYVNSAGNDYSLIAASPATSAGLPAYASIGALQRSQTGSPVGPLIESPLTS